MKNNQSGRSMVEMLGVLAIIGVLSAGGLAGYSKAMFKHKLNTTMDQITMLVTNIRTMYGTQENYTGLSVPQSYKLGIISSSAYQAATSSMTNPFKGYVKLDPYASKGTNDANSTSGFIVTYSGLPKEACIQLVSADWGSGAGSGFVGVCTGEAKANDVESITQPSQLNAVSKACTVTTIGGTKATTNKTYYEGMPFVVADAIAACQGETNTISLYFY